MQQLIVSFDLDEAVPMQVTVSRVHKVPIHWHRKTLEIVLPLEGAVLVRESYETFRVEPGDFAFVNADRSHSIESCEEGGSVVALFNLKLTAFEALHEDIATMTFRNQPPEGGDTAFKKTRAAHEFRYLDLLTNVLSRHLALSGRLRHEELQQQAEQILSLAMHDFFSLYYTKGRYWYISEYQLGRFNRTVRYVSEHYQGKISVSDILSREFISRTYFSQFWAKFSNQSFSEFLLMKRLVISEPTLLSTSMSLEEVAKSVGFSAVRYYYKYFFKCYHCRPLEYKTRCLAYQREARPAEPLDERQAQLLLHTFQNRYIEPGKELRRVLDAKAATELYRELQVEIVRRQSEEDEREPQQEIMTIDLTGSKNILPQTDGGCQFNFDRICELLTLAETTRMTPLIRMSYAVLRRRGLKDALFVLLDRLEEIYGVQRLKNWQYFLLCNRPRDTAEENAYLRRMRERLGANPVYITLEL